MSTSTLANTLRIGLIAILMSIITPDAMAQRDTAPRDECLTRIARVTEGTIHFNHHTADRTVRSIRVLDDEGAPDEVIIEAGRVGKAAINHRTQASVSRIGTIVETCIEHLREHDAPPAAIAAIIRAGSRAIQAIRTSSDRAKARIDHAVANAIEG